MLQCWLERENGATSQGMGGPQSWEGEERREGGSGDLPQARPLERHKAS